MTRRPPPTRRVVKGELMPRPRFIPAQRVWLPLPQLLGRVMIELSAGPATATAVARRCGVGLDELDAAAPSLRGHVVALRVPGDHMLATWSESASALFDAMEPHR